MNSIIDTILLKNGRQVKGVVDFVGKKQLWVYDFSDCDEVDLLTLICLWKGNEPQLRFSVWLLREFNSTYSFRAKILNKNDIVETSANLDETPITKPRHRRIKKIHVS